MLKVDRSYIKYKLVVILVENIFALLGGFLTLLCFDLNRYTSLLVITVLILFVWEIMYVIFYVKNTHVFIRESNICLFKGNWYKREVSVPVSKVYAIIKKQNIIEKMFGVMSCEVQTSAKIYSIHGIECQEGDIFILNWNGE